MIKIVIFDFLTISHPEAAKLIHGTIHFSHNLKIYSDFFLLKTCIYHQELCASQYKQRFFKRKNSIQRKLCLKDIL